MWCEVEVVLLEDRQSAASLWLLVCGHNGDGLDLAISTICAVDRDSETDQYLARWQLAVTTALVFSSFFGPTLSWFARHQVGACGSAVCVEKRGVFPRDGACGRTLGVAFRSQAYLVAASSWRR